MYLKSAWLQCISLSLQLTRHRTGQLTGSLTGALTGALTVPEFVGTILRQLCSVIVEMADADKDLQAITLKIKPAHSSIRSGILFSRAMQGLSVNSPSFILSKASKIG